MFIPTVFCVSLTLLTTSFEKPLCCYASEQGWVVYALGAPDVHILRPNIREAFTERIVLLSSKLTPSNLKNHKLAALVTENRLVLEYAYDFGEGWLPKDGSYDTRCRGECSIKDLFDGRVVDREGKPSSLFSVVIHSAITGDLIEASENEILGVHCYEAQDRTRMLGWFKSGGLSNKTPPEEKYNVPCPFQGHFKCLNKKNRYYFVADTGILYTSACDKDGKPQAVLPVFLGFREPIMAVVTVTSTKKTYIFTQNKYFELGDDIPSPMSLHDLKRISYLKTGRLSNELTDRTKDLYYRLVQDKVIKPVKLETK